MRGADDRGESKARKRRMVDGLDAAHALFAPTFARARDERLGVAHLDRQSRLIGYRFRFSGWTASVELPLRTMVVDAVALDTHALLIAHNHPSGDPDPSEADLAATRTLVMVANALGIRVRDHLTYGGGSFVSLRERGLL